MPQGELAWRVDSTTVKACMSGKEIDEDSHTSMMVLFLLCVKNVC